MLDIDKLEFGETPPYFTEQFCNDIKAAAESDYSDWYAPLRSDLHLYDDDEKLEIIKSELVKVRKNLEGSHWKSYFSVEDMKISLKECLAAVFEDCFISEATGVETSLSMVPGEYKVDPFTKMLTVYPTISLFHGFIDLDFATLNMFKTLVEYVSWCMSFHKLKELDAEIRGIKISNHEQKLPEPIIAALNKSQKDLTVIPILDLDENGEFIHEPIDTNEVISTTKKVKLPFLIPNQDAIDQLHKLSIEENSDTITPKQSDIASESINNEHSLPPKFLQYFKVGAYELFCYLESEYIIHDKKKPTKYSNLYHFCQYEQLIIFTQDEFRKFIEKERGIKMSKIFPKTHKYNDSIFSILSGFKKDFEKGNKKEMY